MMKKNEHSDLKTVLEKYILEHIPITSPMGIRVDQATPEQVILFAPSSPNINHKMTVFGGSLHAVATLACWGLLYLKLLEINLSAQIVISSSEVQYLAPVTTDFKAECHMPDSIEWKKFIKILERKGKGRIKLHAKIFQDHQLAVSYTGTFVALKTEREKS